MRDVAKAANCSVMTVSLALRGGYGVAAKTKEHVRAIAKQLGYRPNPLVSALVSQRRTGTRQGAESIAVLTKFDKPISTWKEPQIFYSSLYEGICAQAEDLGFSVEEFPVWGEHSVSGARLTRILRTRGIRGILLFPGGGLDRGFPPLNWEHFSVVACAFHADEMPIHRTASNHFLSMATCLQELEKRGYRRIGLSLTTSLDPEVRYAFSARFLAWQASQPKRDQIPLIRGSREQLTIENFAKWIKRYQPDCVITFAVPADEWLKRLGYQIPSDIGVASVSLRGCTHLAGIDYRISDVGRTTVRVLARELFLNHTGFPEFPEVTLINNGLWSEGPSIRPVSSVFARPAIQKPADYLV